MSVHLRGQKGFSIVELMIATTITLIFAGSFYYASLGLQKHFESHSVYFETDRSARFGMDRIAQDVREAVNVAPSWGGNSTGNSVLVLKLPSINASGEATNISTQFDYVTYKLDSSDPTKLVRSVDVLGGVSFRNGGSDTSNVTIGKKLQTLTFSSGGTGLSSFTSSALQSLKRINVAITAQGKTVGQNNTTQVDSDLMLRNRLS